MDIKDTEEKKVRLQTLENDVAALLVHIIGVLGGKPPTPTTTTTTTTNDDNDDNDDNEDDSDGHPHAALVHAVCSVLFGADAPTSATRNTHTGIHAALLAAAEELGLPRLAVSPKTTPPTSREEAAALEWGILTQLVTLVGLPEGAAPPSLKLDVAGTAASADHMSGAIA